ncbi:MAG: hypothetical protein HC906_10985 [Bacteroidales bacterium]|nr:hypothetical protein [Bacteroidales bacterium]
MKIFYEITSDLPKGTETDFFIFISSRPGMISYHPRLEAYPATLPNYYGLSNILIVYPEISSYYKIPELSEDNFQQVAKR